MHVKARTGIRVVPLIFKMTPSFFLTINNNMYMYTLLSC